MFDFRTPISRDITLYAKWYDRNDTTDTDGDGLTNLQESNYGTNMRVHDTDHDGLTDYEEVMQYRTNPLEYDTDNDGVDDGTEIRIGSNPLVTETSFETVSGTSSIADGNNDAVDISVKMRSSSQAAGTLRISPAGQLPLMSRISQRTSC